MQTNNNTNKDKRCFFCVNGLDDIDYKDGVTLRKFISAQGKIMPTRRSHMCAKHQRKLAEAVKRARIMAIIPFVSR